MVHLMFELHCCNYVVKLSLYVITSLILVIFHNLLSNGILMFSVFIVATADII